MLYNAAMSLSAGMGSGKMRAWAATTLALAWLLLLAPAARAHGYIVRAIPADRSSLERPPTRLQYWFSEDLEPRFSTIHLRDQTGEILASGAVAAHNAALLELRAPPALADGAYIVELRPAFASDGHVIAESRVFFVGDEVGGFAGNSADDRALPLEALWRALLNVAHFLLFGGSLLYSAVLLPAWGDAQQAGRLPPRVMRRLLRTFVAALALAFAANGIALLQQSMVFFGSDAATVLQQGLWRVVLIGSRFGDIWVFRLILSLFCAVLLFVAEYYRALMPHLAAGIWRGLPWLSALLLGTSMITSHSAGAIVLPWLAIAVNWLHMLAVAFWLGGAWVLTLVAGVALSPYGLAQQAHALRAVLLRFSRLVSPLLLLLLLSGLYNALTLLFSPADLTSSYGRSLGLKLLVALPALLLGAWHHIALRPELATGIAAIGQRLLGDRLSFARSLRLEALLMLLPLLAVAWLSATPVPPPPLLAASIAAPAATTEVAGLQVAAALFPGGPGVNTIDITLQRDNVPVTDAQVVLQFSHPARDRRSPWLPTEPLDSGLYAAASDAIDRAGRWWLLVDINLAAGETARAAFDWDISADAAVQQTRPPAPQHILLLLLLLLLLMTWAGRRLRHMLAPKRVGLPTLLLSLGALLLSLGILLAGGTMIARQQAQYEQTIHPPPALQNTVLPDAHSLQRGAALFREHCSAWQGASDFDALRRRLSSARDDFLYDVVSSGWRDLGACAGTLDADARWHIVNFLRSLEPHPL